MGTEVAETLAQVDAQAEIGVQCGDWSCSGSEIQPLAVVGQENGVRVSAEEEMGNVGVETEIVAQFSVKTEVVETQIAAEKGVVEGGGLLVEEASNIEEVLASKHERDVVESGDGDKEVKCLVDSDPAGLVGDGSDNKVELEQNEVSLVVEFHCPADCVDDCGEDGDKRSVAEKGGVQEEKLTESPGTEGRMGENGDMKGEGVCKQKDTRNGMLSRVKELEQGGPKSASRWSKELKHPL